MLSPQRINFLNNISRQIISSAIEVHKELGPGLYESVYKTCLIQELQDRNIDVQSEVFLPLYYKGILRDDKSFRIDLLVENEVIVEMKAVEKIIPIHEVQLLTYLKLSNKNLGLLINFNVRKLVDGITRKIYSNENL